MKEQRIRDILNEWLFLIEEYGLEDDDALMTVGGKKLKEEVRRKILRLKIPR